MQSKQRIQKVAEGLEDTQGAKHALFLRVVVENVGLERIPQSDATGLQTLSGQGAMLIGSR